MEFGAYEQGRASRLGSAGLRRDGNGSGELRHLLTRKMYLVGANIKRSLKPISTRCFRSVDGAPLSCCSQPEIISRCDVNHVYPPANGGNTSTVWPARSTSCFPYREPSQRNEQRGTTRARSALRAASASASAATVVPGRHGQHLIVKTGRCAGRSEVAKACTAMEVATAFTSATDRAHRSRRLDEPGVVDAVPGGLVPHRCTPCGLDFIVVRTRAQQLRRSVSAARTGSFALARQP